VVAKQAGCGGAGGRPLVTAHQRPWCWRYDEAGLLLLLRSARSSARAVQQSNDEQRAEDLPRRMVDPRRHETAGYDKIQFQQTPNLACAREPVALVSISTCKNFDAPSRGGLPAALERCTLVHTVFCFTSCEIFTKVVPPRVGGDRRLRWRRERTGSENISGGERGEMAEPDVSGTTAWRRGPSPRETMSSHGVSLRHPLSAALWCSARFGRKKHWKWMLIDGKVDLYLRPLGKRRGVLLPCGCRRVRSVYPCRGLIGVLASFHHDIIPGNPIDLLKVPPTPTICSRRRPSARSWPWSRTKPRRTSASSTRWAISWSMLRGWRGELAGVNCRLNTQTAAEACSLVSGVA